MTLDVGPTPALSNSGPLEQNKRVTTTRYEKGTLHRLARCNTNGDRISVNS